jgi:hypothetical protein
MWKLVAGIYTKYSAFLWSDEISFFSLVTSYWWKLFWVRLVYFNLWIVIYQFGWNLLHYYGTISFEFIKPKNVSFESWSFLRFRNIPELLDDKHVYLSLVLLFFLVLLGFDLRVFILVRKVLYHLSHTSGAFYH